MGTLPVQATQVMESRKRSAAVPGRFGLQAPRELDGQNGGIFGDVRELLRSQLANSYRRPERHVVVHDRPETLAVGTVGIRSEEHRNKYAVERPLVELAF